MSHARQVTLLSGATFEPEEIEFYNTRFCRLKKLYTIFMDQNEDGGKFTFSQYCRMFYNIPEELTILWEQQGGCL